MAEALVAVMGIWVLVVIAPGPDFVVTVHYASSVSRRHGVMAALGVNCGLLLWVAASMLGLSVLMARMSWLYEIVRLAGAAYLVYLGVRLLWSTRRRTQDLAADALSAPNPPKTVSLFRAWRTGLFSDLANPKAVVFFGSLLGTMLPPQSSVGFRAVVVAAIIATSSAWYLIVATGFGSAPVARLYQRLRRWIDRVTATVFIGLGVRLATDQ